MNAEYMLKMLEVYSGLGRTIHVSEITIPSYDGSPELLEAQAVMAETLYKLWFSVEKIGSIVWWNLVDGYAYSNPDNPDWSEDYYGGGLLKNDFTPKPAFEAVNRLINKEWKTNLAGATEEHGNLAFCGFFGDYKIMVEKNGFATEHKVKLTKSSPFIDIRLG